MKRAHVMFAVVSMVLFACRLILQLSPTATPVPSNTLLPTPTPVSPYGLDTPVPTLTPPSPYIPNLPPTPVPSNIPLPTAIFFTPTPYDSLHVFGNVWTMVHGQFHGVAGATVGIRSCFPRSFDFHSESDEQGHFDIFVPNLELNCGITMIRVTIPGYIPQYFAENVTDLRTLKSYDFVLVPEATATPH